MRVVLALAALLLTGCPGAMLLGAGAHEGDRPFVHLANASDYAAWEGEPVASLETHSRLSRLRRDIRPGAEGAERWHFRECKQGGDCCLHEFDVRASVIASYRTGCQIDCTARPDAKVQACIAAARVPDGYH